MHDDSPGEELSIIMVLYMGMQGRRAGNSGCTLKKLSRAAEQTSSVPHHSRLALELPGTGRYEYWMQALTQPYYAV